MSTFIDEPNYIFKIFMLGDSNVGKTNIASRYGRNEFNFETKSTIGIDFFFKKIKYKEQQIRIELWDTAGQERYRSITKSLYYKSNGIAIVYDITNLTSFTNVVEWINEIHKYINEKNIPIILIGNKNDWDIKRVVSYEDGLEIAKKYNLLFFETSALKNVNIMESFDKLIEQIYTIKKEEERIEQERTEREIIEQEKKLLYYKQSKFGPNIVLSNKNNNKKINSLNIYDNTINKTCC